MRHSNFKFFPGHHVSAVVLKPFSRNVKSYFDNIKEHQNKSNHQEIALLEESQRGLLRFNVSELD